MITNQRIHLPIQVSKLQPYEIILEGQCSSLPMLFPILELYNTEIINPRGADVAVALRWTLDLGTSPDPICSGEWNKELINPPRIVPPRDLFIHRFDTAFADWQCIPAIRHSLTITTEAEYEILVHGILEGVYDLQIMRR